MDSSVIVDDSSKFGQGTKLDRDFPGFPFDDGFGRRSTNIRSYLDDLAVRHPEFADQLLGPLWGDVPLSSGKSPHRTWRTLLNDTCIKNSNNRRGNTNQYHNPNEEVLSRTTGSSSTSSVNTVSSHDSEPEHQQQRERKIPQNGFRNTLDTDKRQDNMENPQQQRNVRSMSAPPENLISHDTTNQHPDQQRFISRVEITPKSQQQSDQLEQQSQQQQQQREKSPSRRQKSQTQQQSGNVRHIPIFVEGRDKPVIPKEVDETDFPKHQSPQFQRPSHFQQHYNKHPPGWSSHFSEFDRESFFEPPHNRWGQPQFRYPHEPWTQQHFSDPHQQRPQTHQHQMYPEIHQQKSQAQQKQPEQQKSKNEIYPELLKSKQQIQPKEPLERVAMVQKEVDALTEQVKAYKGNSRQDKQYIYLDEMLTRELIKLDDIDTEGKENVRQARKQAIKSIQESISLLESKVPLPGQESELQLKEENKKQSIDSNQKPEEKPTESIENFEELTDQEEQQKAIPLPPPFSSIKDTLIETQKQQKFPVDQLNESAKVSLQKPSQNIDQTSSTQGVNSVTQKAMQKMEEIQKFDESVDNNATDNTTTAEIQQEQQSQEMEIRQSSPVEELQVSVVEQHHQDTEDNTLQTSETEKESKEKNSKEESPLMPEKPSKLPKKAKKSKKHIILKSEPVSETAIPLPPPDQSI